MDKKLTFLLVGVVIIIIGVILSLNIQPDFDNNKIINTEPDNSNLVPDNQFKDVQFVLYNGDASIAWQLESGIINNYSENKILELSPIEIDAVRIGLDTDDADSNGDKISERLIYQLEGKEAIYNINTGEIEIKGPINIIKDEIKFYTSKLDWQDGKALLKATGGVTIDSPYFSLLGREMNADLALNDVVVKGEDENQAFFTWKKGSDSN